MKNNIIDYMIVFLVCICLPLIFAAYPWPSDDLEIRCLVDSQNPKEQCSVYVQMWHDSPVYFYFSDSFQQKYEKPSEWITVSCDAIHPAYDVKLNSEMQFVCPDGTVAMELFSCNDVVITGMKFACHDL